MPELAHFRRTDELDLILENLRRDGGVIIDDFVSTADADGLLTDFGVDLDVIGWGNQDEDDGDAGDAFFGYRTKRLHGLVGRSAIFERVLTDPFGLACAEGVMGGYSSGMIMSTHELMAIGPGEVQQSFHRDADTWQHMPRPHPELLVSFNVALTDFTAANGATVVVPGSHRWERQRQPDGNAATQAVMSKGAALLYVGDVIHGGGANATEQTRVGMYFGYIPSWLRPQENPYVTLSADVLAQLSPAAQRLLGYSTTGFELVL